MDLSNKFTYLLTYLLMSLIYVFVYFLIKLTVRPFLLEQICQLAGQLRVTPNGFNR